MRLKFAWAPDFLDWLYWIQYWIQYLLVKVFDFRLKLIPKKFEFLQRNIEVEATLVIAPWALHGRPNGIAVHRWWHLFDIMAVTVIQTHLSLAA